MSLISNRKGSACINAMIIAYPAGNMAVKRTSMKAIQKMHFFYQSTDRERKEIILFRFAFCVCCFFLILLRISNFCIFLFFIFDSASTPVSSFFHSLGFFFFLHFLGFCTILLRFHPSLATFHDHLSPRYALPPPQQFGHMIEC